MKYPARVHIILAREAETAIVIRRGPTKAVCTMLWDRKRDTFLLGQWLRGRIYELRCDLSPNGKHFIYLALNNSTVLGSWTAISRTPYLKAIGLWKNSGTWFGGGLFMTDSKYWLNSGIHHDGELRTPTGLSEHKGFPFHECYGGGCEGVYFIRLQRDGWKLIARSTDKKGDPYSIFEKKLPEGWVLRKISHASYYNHPPGTGYDYDTHSLHHAERQIDLEFPKWEWADLDSERLAWVQNGVLSASRLTSDGLGPVQELYDFNRLNFKAIKAPY
jgi:hypothetical protein